MYGFMYFIINFFIDEKLIIMFLFDLHFFILVVDG
jgi:hypothetical protein